MQLNHLSFKNLTPQDFEDNDCDGVDLHSQKELMSPFYQSKIADWIYKWRGSSWELSNIEINNCHLLDASDAERGRLDLYFGLGLPIESIIDKCQGFLFIEADTLRHAASRHYTFYISGLIYSRMHLSDGSLYGVGVCDVQSDRLSRSLTGEIKTLEDILVCEDTLHEVGLVKSYLAGRLPCNIKAQTGVFLPAHM